MSEIICPSCRTVLYRSNSTYVEGERVRAADLVQVNAVYPPGQGVGTVCPDDGPVVALVRLADGREVPVNP